MTHFADIADERVEATRKADVNAAAPKSAVKPHEASPEDDVEEREVRSSVKAGKTALSNDLTNKFTNNKIHLLSLPVHATPPGTPPADPITNVEQERSEKEDVIAKGKCRLSDTRLVNGAVGAFGELGKHNIIKHVLAIANASYHRAASVFTHPLTKTNHNHTQLRLRSRVRVIVVAFALDLPTSSVHQSVYFA